MHVRSYRAAEMKWFLLIVSLGAVVIAGGTPAHACVCAGFSISQDSETTAHFKSASAVFLGTVVEVIPTQTRIKQSDNSETVVVNYHVRFVVKQVFKGVVGSSVTTDNGSSGDDCSFGEMSMGRDYLVYAYSRPFAGSPLVLGCCEGNQDPTRYRLFHETSPQLSVGLCSGTRPVPDESHSESSREWHARELEFLRYLSLQRPVLTRGPFEQGKLLFERAMAAFEAKRFDVANLAFQTLVNTHPDSEYARKAKLALEDPRIANCGQSWNASPACDGRNRGDTAH